MKIKKLASLVLALVMCLTLCVPAMAADTQPDNNSRHNFSESDQTDLDIISSLFGAVDVTISSMGADGAVVYKKEFENGAVDYIQIAHGNGGAILLDISEGACHDVLRIMPDGSIFLDGNKVMINVQRALNSEVGLPPRSIRTIEHSEAPFSGTTASQYSIYVSTVQKADINAHKLIKNLTIGGITTILGGAVGAVIGSAFAGSAAAVIFGGVAASLKGFAAQHAPDSAYFSYIIKKYEHNSKSTPIDLYHK